MENKKVMGKLVSYLLNIVLVFIVVLPLLFSITSSFRPHEDIFKYISPITWKTFIPTDITFSAYKDIFTESGFGRIFFNTFFVGIVTVALGLLVNSMAAFAFSVFSFRGKKIVFFIVLLTFMVPFEVIAVPLYKVVSSLGFIDSYSALIIPVVANGLVIFLYKQFFDDLPLSIFESARMDGASWWRIYYGIVLPLSKPVTITAGLLIFVGQWESFLWPLLATHSDQYRVIQVAMSTFSQEHATIWNQLFAASNLTIVVPAILLLFLQKYFVNGIANTGVKE
ncbi:sugar ABC transporter permease [Pullulanibacillus camelliae]|uniref:Sugar ABC transporter permease n=1 Tax=Pullulanibacillus camelliae TaxID=1707096 RepID=A0A8J2VK53_9BACL|nr:carbohydrate ABC transporter permease [Pullulanibacillus camelliae]GGE27822.1 sugar ABC transporter permease [Pullulanibacillus camelliae]